MKLFDISPLTQAVRDVAGELRRIREILEPAQQSGTSFRSGYQDPTSTPDDAELLQTSEFQGFLRQEMEKFYGRTLSPNEEAELSAEADAPHTAARVVDGYSRGIDPKEVRAQGTPQE